MPSGKQGSSINQGSHERKAGSAKDPGQTKMNPRGGESVFEIPDFKNAWFMDDPERVGKGV